jgi:hypothetical protein
MKDVNGAYRAAIFSALNGNLSYNSVNVPVFSGYAEFDGNLYVVLENANDVQSNINKNKFITQCTINIEIINYQTRGTSYVAVDNVYEQIMEILIPEPFKAGFTANGFQVMNPEVTSVNHLIEQGLEKVVRKIIRLRTGIVQSNVY